MDKLKIINRWQCWGKSIYRSIWTLPYIVSGHLLVEEYDNKQVSVCRCERCGLLDVSYYKQYLDSKK